MPFHPKANTYPVQPSFAGTAAALWAETLDPPSGIPPL